MPVCKPVEVGAGHNPSRSDRYRLEQEHGVDKCRVFAHVVDGVVSFGLHLSIAIDRSRRLHLDGDRGLAATPPGSGIDMVVIGDRREQLELAVGRDHRVQRQRQLPGATELRFVHGANLTSLGDRFVDPMASDFVKRRVRLPRSTSPPIKRSLVRSLVGGTRDIGDRQLAPILWDDRLVERHRSIQPALQSLKARLAPTPLNRPAQPGEMRGQRLRRHAVPVGMLNAVDVDRQPGGRVAAR